MPVDDRDDVPAGSSPEETKKEEIREALQSETDKPLPPAAERIAERDADRPEPRTPQGQRRRWLSRRNALLATLGILGVIVIAFIGIFFAYKLGFIDRYVANQIKQTLAAYNIRAEIKEFHTAFSPRTVEMRDIELYDSVTGAHLGKIDRLLATVRIEDLYAFNLKRNVNLESLVVDNPEVWVEFDKDGNSNFRNIKLPQSEQNKRILFSYSTAKVQVNNALVHYGDEQHKLSGEARNILATIQPDDPNAPAASWMNTVNVAMTNSTFVYDGRPINNIDISASGRINQTRAEIQDITLRSPVAEAHLSGVMDDWRALHYNLNATSTVDLTQLSDVLQTGTALRGVGNFVGTVTGEGARYQVDGSIKADALAADGVRVQALQVNAKATGDGKNYEANGRALAELLTAGELQLNQVQLAGGVMGTGTDFRWLGELRAAAARYGQTTIAGLMIRDAVAESHGDTLTASAPSATANSVNASNAKVGGLQARDVRVRSEKGVTTATVASVQAGTVTASSARVNGATASGVNVVSRDGGATNVTVDQLRVNGLEASNAKVGSLNIAGVRLAIVAGRVEGSSGDINAGTVQLAQSKGTPGGHLDNVKLARPAFVLEPSGRYRASADLSLGGGVLASVNLGTARAAVVASNDQIQLNNFDANISGGHAAGNATINTARGPSRVNANFNDLDIGNLIAVMSGRVVPIAGKATGTVDLGFPGTDFKAASGNVNAAFNGETGNEESGRTPLTGEVALLATRGLFQIERATLRTAASELTATGQFTFNNGSDASNLQVNLASNDASELQRVFTSSGLFPSVEDQLNNYGVELGGRLAFNGTVRGNLTDPNLDGRASVDSLVMNGRDLGALTASLNVTPAEIRVTDGRLTERDGGGVQFALNAPRTGTNNISVDATLDRANAGNLIAALPFFKPPTRERLSDLRSDLSGRISVTGLPEAMTGNADLRFGAGTIGGESFESIVARATFAGSNVNLENVDARFNAGHITASGNINTKDQSFDLQARGTGIQLDRLLALTNRPNLPQLTGVADLEARASGNLNNFSSFQINFNGEGRDVTINGRPAGTLSLVGRTENQKLDVQFTTGLLGQPQVVSARVDLSNDRLPTTIETSLTGADLTPLFAALMPPGTTVRVTGHATGTLKASGNLYAENPEGEDIFGLAGLKGTANFSDLTVQIEDIQLTATSPLLVQFSTSEIFFEKTQFTGPGTNIVFGGTAALGEGGRQNLTVDGRLNLRVLNSLSPDTFFGGTADVAVRVGGSFEDPRINGSAAVAGGSVSTLIGDQRLTLANVKGRVIFNSNQAQIESLTGTLGGGRVVASGGALLSGFVPTRYRFNVRGDNVVLPYPEDFISTADANLEINGTAREQIISGTVNLRRTEYTQDIELATLINRRGEASLTEGGGESSFAETTQLDLRVEGRDALVVRNNLADLVGSVSLRVTGPIVDPVISGRITASRGTLSFRNDRYNLTRAFIDLPAQRDADPILNIQAESDIKGYNIIVSLTGPLTHPNATVRSDPSLPQADVVSLITTGNLASSDTSASTLAQTGLGTAASLLTDTLINAPAQKATGKLFGLNRFEIDPLIGGRGGASPTARLTVGRQINRNLSITYSTNVTSNPNQVLALEYRVSDRLSFIAQYEQGATNTFNARSNNFSFEISFRRRF